jgi:hypothetical protein
MISSRNWGKKIVLKSSALINENNQCCGKTFELRSSTHAAFATLDLTLWCANLPMPNFA